METRTRSSLAPKGASNDQTYQHLLEMAAAPARAMSYVPQQQDMEALGMWGQVHQAIDPVQAFGGYGNTALMGLMPSARTPQPRPIKGYHGTRGEWSKFDMTKSTREAYGSGMHVATDPALANMFSRQFKDGGTVMPVEMHLKNTASQKVYHKFAQKHNYNPKATTKALTDAGYDSVEYNHGKFFWPSESGKLVQSAPGQDKAFAILTPGRVKSAITGETLFGTGAAGIGAAAAVEGSRRE